MSVKSSTADSSVRIRIEHLDSALERAEVRAVHESAFDGVYEADLVDQLRASEHAFLSLVAELGNRVVGHILFSRMWIRTTSGLLSAVALAPVGVHPEHQHKGIGSLLIQRGLDLSRSRGEEIVLVVGHPDYYPRFGFSSTQAASLRSPFPREAFMALELRPNSLAGVQGAVVYPSAFGIREAEDCSI